MRRLAPFALLLAAACSSGSSHAAAPRPATPSPTASMPSCAAVFTQGATIPATITSGCVNVQGDIYVPGTFDCTDGTRLLSDQRGWGYVGKTMHAGKLTDSAPFKAAYAACNG